ncbi:MAG: DUF2399 domain-containing protein [Mycobacteriales bacterium]
MTDPARLPPKLVEWTRAAGPSLVLDEVRDRARRGFDTENGTLRVALTATQRREVARLIGTPWDVSGRPVRLKDLAAALAEHRITVRQLIEQLDGHQVINQREVRAAQRAAATAERSAVAALLAGAGIDADIAGTWLADPGLPRPGEGDLRALTEQMTRVWQRLPTAAERPVRLARLAAEVTGDAHALDYRTDLGRAVVRLIALTQDLPRPLAAGRDWRRAWAAAGVRCDEISSRVLVLNLPLRGDAAAARWSTAAPGEPLWLSLRSISGDWSAVAGSTVHVCENPTVVESAADRFGAHCQPLVCTDGIPSIAALDLIAGLAAAGCTIRARADVDENGFVVVEQVRSVAPAATTWRYDSTTYAQQLGLTGIAEPSGDENSMLRRLRELYAELKIPLHEEALLDLLLHDLSPSPEDAHQIGSPLP